MRITRPPLPTLDDVAPPLTLRPPATFSVRCRRCKGEAPPDDEGHCRTCGGEVDFVPEC